MPRKKKVAVAEPEVKYFVDGHNDVREYYESPKQFEINWEKIAADVKEAALMVEANYEKDDGPLTTEQLEQIQLTAPKPKRTRKAK